MARPRAADDFAAIRVRMEREQAERPKDAGRLDERRWQVAEELRERFNTRRNSRAGS